jgi:hypothetical protein
MKNAVFWDVAPCRYCVNRHFRGTYCLHLQGRKKNVKIREQGTSVSRWLVTLVPRSQIFLFSFYPEDGSDTFHRNVGLYNIYTAPHPRRRHSSAGILFRAPKREGVLASSLLRMCHHHRKFLHSETSHHIKAVEIKTICCISTSERNNLENKGI